MKEENLLNMMRCPKFESCSIPKCPLDKDMDKCVELPEDDVCILRRFMGKRRNSRMKGILSPKMKGLLEFVPNNK